MKKKLKKPVFVIVFAICSLCFSNFVYIYYFSKVIGKDKNGEAIYPLKIVILTLITFGIYGIIWINRISKQLDLIDNQNSYTLVSTIFAICFMKCISLAIISDRIEKINKIQRVEND